MSLHTLAFDLGYTVADLCKSMTYQEFVRWILWYKEREKQNSKPSSGGAIDLDSMSKEEVKAQWQSHST